MTAVPRQRPSGATATGATGRSTGTRRPRRCGTTNQPPSALPGAPHTRAERLEDLVWSEAKRVLQNAALIVAGIEALEDREGGGLAEEIAKAELELRSVQMEEDRAIRLYVSGKITEDQLDLQRKFITERLESLRAKVDDYRAREASGARKRELTEAVLAWARVLTN